MYDIDLIDESFSRKLSHTYHLSIQTGINGLSFTILDLSKLKYIVLRHYPFEGLENDTEISNYLSINYKQDDLLKLNYKSVSHSFISNNSTLVPASQFEPSLAADYLYLIKNNNKNQTVSYNAVSSGVLYTIFSYPSLLESELKRIFPGIKLFHHTSAFLEFLTREKSDYIDPQLYIYINEGLLNIGLLNGSELLFFNSFKYKEKTDIIYFILSVLDQYKLSPKDTYEFISADVDNHDEIFDFLNNYLGEIKFIKPSQEFSFSYLFDQLHLTRFTNLFNLALCE